MKSTHGLVLMMALGLGILIGVGAPAADPVSQEQIQKLIDQMGSGKFEEREKASEQLDKIGPSALKALRKASKSDDAEVRRRAEELVSKIEKREENIRLLAPSKVHLVYKDMAVADAVKEFAKKTGYAIVLMDPQNKLKNRKISLDTGDVTFWTALDLLCHQAGLVEANASDLLRLMPQPNAVPFPGGNGKGPFIQPARPALLPAQPPAKPVDKQPRNPAPPQGQPNPAQPAIPPPGAAQAQVALLEVQVRTNPPVALPGQPGIGQFGGFGFAGGPWVGGFPANQITLIEGKSKNLPTDSSSAVRVRVTDQFKPMGKAPAKPTRQIWLQISPEPKLQLVSVASVRVDKAVDDQGQKLNQVQSERPHAVPGVQGLGALGQPGIGGIARRAGFGGLQGGAFSAGASGQFAMVQFEKAEKPSKEIKELTGVISAQVMVPAKPVFTVDKLMQMASKEVKGQEGGVLKVLEVTRGDDDQLKVRLEMDGPANAGNPFAIQGVILAPAVPVAPAPPAKAPPQPLPGKGKAPVQKQAQAGNQAQPLPPPVAQAGPIRIAQQAQAQIQVQIGQGGVGGPGGVVFFGGNAFGNGGFTVVDDKGDTVRPTAISQTLQASGNVIKMEHTLTFRLQKGQEAVKLLYSTSKVATIDIPFALKNVSLP